jgi:hypothetical protein
VYIITAAGKKAVHSKKRGDGFVDTAEKMQLMCAHANAQYTHARLVAF